MTLRHLIELRKEHAEQAAKRAELTGATNYAHLSAELALALQSVLDAEIVDTVEIKGQLALTLAGFLRFSSVQIELDEYLAETEPYCRRSEILAALDREGKTIPSCVSNAAAQRIDTGSANSAA